MKKAKITITFNVCDDFEAGKCPLCPYQTRTYFENHYISETVKCLLGYTNVTCPVEILEEGGAECNTSVAELDKMPMISKKHKGGADMRGDTNG